MGNSFMTSAVFAAIMALRSEFKEERQASSRPRRTEDRTIIIPSRPTKLQYRRIKRDILGSLIGNTILVLVLVVLPAGLFCWAFLPLIVDGNYIAFYFLLFVALIFFSILRPFLKTIEKRNNELEKLNKKDVNDSKLKDITTIMIAINIKDKYKRYEYIYDRVCSYLDERISKGYCEFKNDI